MQGDLRRETRYVVTRNIGRIGEGDVERAAKRLAPGSDEKSGAVGEPQRCRIPLGGARRLLGEIDADAEGGGQPAQQGEKEATRSGTEIDDAQHGGAVRDRGK